MQGSETKVSFHPQSRYGAELQVSPPLALLPSPLCDKSIYEGKEKEKKKVTASLSTASPERLNLYSQIEGIREWKSQLRLIHAKDKPGVG